MKDKRICQYRITNQLLGQGSFSKVYLAYTKSQEKVAVKIIPRYRIQQSEINLFQNEIKLLNRCKNQHIISCIDVKKTKTNFYIFLQYCEGGNLAEYIQANTKLGETQAIRIFTQIVKAMNAMSKINVVHRDLKPANIMLKNGNIKIVDFGLARKYAKGQMLDTRVGTPLNMAPQILKGQPYNQKADVYSAGTILYEMLYGIMPYIGKNQHNLIANINSKQMNLPKQCLTSLPTKCLLQKMLQPLPSERLDFCTVLIELHKITTLQIQQKLSLYKLCSSRSLPYISILGGICSFFYFDFQNVKEKSVYDLDLKICAKLGKRLIHNQLEWLKNIDLIRV